jgi:tetratricopeptide (TPR) repeat protein
MKNSLPQKSAYKVLLLLLLISLAPITGCSLPRLYILSDPLTPEEHLNLGVSYEQKGELDNALKEYRLASNTLPRAYLYAGNIYFLKKDWEEAQKSYNEAIKRDPQNADAYNNLAWLYYTKGEKLQEAEDLAMKALELNPAKPAVYQDSLEKIREKKREVKNR